MSNIKYMLKNARNRRIIFSVIAVMSLLAIFTVFFVLERPGVTMTDDDVPNISAFLKAARSLLKCLLMKNPCIRAAIQIITLNGRFMKTAFAILNPLTRQKHTQYTTVKAI